MSNGIMKAIQTYVDSAINNAGFDKTRTGIIVAKNTNNTYIVRIDGVEYKNIKCINDTILSIGEIVKVHIPNNQASQMYINPSGNTLNSVLIYIDSTKGNIFYNEPINTTLNPQINYGDVVITNQNELLNNFGALATLKWFDEDNNEIEVLDPFNFVVAQTDTINRLKYTVKLFVSDNEVRAEQYIVLGRVNNGTSGTGVKTIVTMYLATSKSEGVTTSDDFTEAVQFVTPEKRYLWTYMITRDTNNIIISTTDPCISGVYGQQGEQGDNGVSVDKVIMYYAISESNVTAPIVGWSTTPPDYIDGQYYWERADTQLNDSNLTIKQGTPVLSKDLNEAITRANNAQQSAEYAARTATDYIQTVGDTVEIAFSQIFNAISIGATDSNHIEITPEKLAFKNDQNQEVAYVKGDSLVIPIATLLTDMRVGYNPNGNGLWSWATRSNRHLQLKWIGGEQ